MAITNKLYFGFVISGGYAEDHLNDNG